MPNPRSRLFSFVAAGVLAALTIVTFYLLRNYGPEKALYRFHDAALSGDQAEIARVTMQSPGTLSVEGLEAIVRMANRAEPEVISYHQTATEATFTILYKLPQYGNRQLVVNWVVQDTAQAGWLINASQTIATSPDFHALSTRPGISQARFGHFFSFRSVGG